jgi:cathepsin X
MYEAQDNECTALNTCRNCMPGEGCFALKNGTYPALFVEQFGPVSTDDSIMKVRSTSVFSPFVTSSHFNHYLTISTQEIFARGPVSCGINADPLENWDGTGVITDDGQTGVNHIISLAGWGVAPDGTKFWYGRNSWGTYWGDRGWFRIKRGGSYNPDCMWGVPSMPVYPSPSAPVKLLSPCLQAQERDCSPQRPHHQEVLSFLPFQNATASISLQCR